MISKIIKSIKKQLNIYNNDFNNKLLAYYDNLDHIKYKLRENVYELTGIIYHILDNKIKYKLGINLHTKPNIEKYIYRKITLTLFELNNLEFCLNSNYINIKFTNKQSINQVYIIISNDNQNLHYKINNINIITLT